MNKRLLSIFLALCMVVTMLPSSAMAFTISPLAIGDIFLAPITIGSNTNVSWKFIILTEPDGETNGTVKIYAPNSGLEQKHTGDLIIPETVTNGGKTYDVTQISTHTFNSCNMSSVFIPKTIGGSIGTDVFSGSPNLTAFVVDPENITFCSEEGILYNKDKTILIKYPPAKTDATFVIPGSVSTLSGAAFIGCNNITSMDIPENVTKMGSHIFYGCSALTDVTIPSGISDIPYAAFINCAALQLITFNGMTAPTLNQYAFAINPIDFPVSLKFKISAGSTGYIGEGASDVWKSLADRFELVPVTNYEIWVGGTQVTSANASDVLGDAKVSYNASTNTLTLTGSNITTAHEFDYNPFSKGMSGIFVKGDLNLVLAGSNSIGGSSFDTTGAVSAGIYVSEGDLNISGTGSLTATAGKADNSSIGVNIESFNKCLTVTGGANVTAIGATGFYSRGVFVNGSLTIDGGSLSAMGDSTGESSHSFGVNGGYINSSFTIKNGGGLIAVGGNAKYTSGGACFLNTTNNIIVDSGNLTASAGEAANVSLGIRGDTISISGGNVTASARKQAMNIAPTYGSGYIHRNTAGSNVDGSGATVLNDSTLVSGIANYKYVSIEPLIKKTPTTDDLTYIMSAVDYDGNAKPLSVAAAPGKTLGATSVKYNGSTTEPINAGIYAVTVDIAENDEYNAVTGLSLGNYTINKIAYPGITTVLASVLTSGQEGATITLPTLPTGASYGTPTAGGSISMTDMSVSGTTLTYTAPASTAGQTGTMTIPVTDATNYNDYSIVVTIAFTEKTPQAISFSDVSVAKTYGDAKFINPLTKTTVNGTITYASDDASVATVNTATGEVTIVAVGDGSATITATATETSTHALATASYTVIVAKKALTLKAEDKSMTKGDGLPAFTYTVTGLVNNDTLATPPTMSTTTNGATVGTFDITISSGVVAHAASYDITYTKGTLTVAECSGGDGGGSSNGGGSSSNEESGSVIITPPAPDKPNTPTQGEVMVHGKVDKKGNATVNITDKAVTDAFDKALADARKYGNEQNGITVVLRIDTGSKTASNVTVNLPKTVQEIIISKKIVNTIVVVDNPDIQFDMDLATVKKINMQAKSNVNITATRMKSSRLTGNAKKTIGSRPVFDLKVNYGKGKQVQNFGTGIVSVTIPYKLGANEKAGNVHAVYVDAKGKVQWIAKSVYDSEKQVLRFSTDHFSTYGIGYKQTNTDL